MKLAGAVLAGGQSKRMGTNKAWIMAQGKSLASRALLTMRKAGLDPLYLNAPVAPQDMPEGVRLLPDDKPGLGPMGGLATLLNVSDMPVLLMACDMPGIKAEDVKGLLQAYEAAPCPGLVAKDEKGWQPLFGIYAPSLLQSLQAAIQKEDYALYRWIESQGMKAWDMMKPERLANLNTPEDLGAWENAGEILDEFI